MDLPITNYIQLTPEQDSWSKHLERKIDKSKILKGYLLKDPYVFKEATKSEKHWTCVYENIWSQRLDNNAKAFRQMRKILLDDGVCWHFKLRHFNTLYSPILYSIKRIHDLSYSYHYILQLHIEMMFENVEVKEKCLSHKDIEEYKDIDIEIEECFCYSYKNIGPKICLYCRE